MYNPQQIMVQLAGIGAAFVWVFASAFLMYFMISLVFGLRVSSMHEQRGLDITEHGEIGYPEFGQDAMYKNENLKQLSKLS